MGSGCLPSQITLGIDSKHRKHYTLEWSRLNMPSIREGRGRPERHTRRETERPSLVGDKAILSIPPAAASAPGLSPGRSCHGATRASASQLEAGRGSSAGRSSAAHASRLPRVSSAAHASPGKGRPVCRGSPASAPRSSRLPWVPGLSPSRSVALGLPRDVAVFGALRPASRPSSGSKPSAPPSAGGMERPRSSKEPQARTHPRKPSSDRLRPATANQRAHPGINLPRRPRPLPAA